MAIIEQQPKKINEKIVFLQTDHGGRAAPLNIGFEHAKGQYALILDDDDLVNEDWVASFAEAAKTHPGKVLHCYPLVQVWAIDDMGVPKPSFEPTKELCTPFVLSKQFSDNHCPPVCMAFPLAGFRDKGIRFDEELDCYEDWDFIMRMVSVYGIHDIEKVTCTYRIWQNAESSHTLNTEEVWAECKEKVTRRIETLQFTITGDDIIKERIFAEESESNLRKMESLEQSIPSSAKNVFSCIMNKIKK